MGCTSSSEHSHERMISKQIDKQLKGHPQKSEKKILILGIGESGKSTILKQLRIIHTQSFTEEECLNCKDKVYSNALRAVCEFMDALTSEHFPMDAQVQEIVDKLADVDLSSFDLSSEHVDAIEELFRINKVRAFMDSIPTQDFSDSTPYFIEHIRRIRDPQYVPNETDMLRVRIQTTGIIEINLEYKGLNMKVCDVGGQRSERKKWISCFENVTTVLFVVATSDYDRCLVEDPTTNRMIESIRLFETLASSPYFRGKPMMVFFNKIDLLKAKLQHVRVADYLEDYEGPDDDMVAIMGFFKQKFIEAGTKTSDRSLYFHETCATDTQSIQYVFDAVTDIMVRENLETLGLG